MKFIRRNWTKKSRLGKKKKKKQVWRRPTGRHSKTREKRKGYPIKVMVGFRQKKEERNLIKNRKPILVRNIEELNKIGKEEIAIIGKIGNKKRIEMIKKAKEKGIEVQNANVNKILKKIRKKQEASASKKDSKKKEENKPEEKK